MIKTILTRMLALVLPGFCLLELSRGDIAIDERLRQVGTAEELINWDHEKLWHDQYRKACQRQLAKGWPPTYCFRLQQYNQEKLNGLCETASLRVQDSRHLQQLLKALAVSEPCKRHLEVREEILKYKESSRSSQPEKWP